jgi:hypothetical protein
VKWLFSLFSDVIPYPRYPKPISNKDIYFLYF